MEKKTEVKKREMVLIRDPTEFKDDKQCVLGDPEVVARYLSSRFKEPNMGIHHLEGKEIERLVGSSKFFWVEFDSSNWSGCGTGGSHVCLSIADAREWIKKKLEETNMNVGDFRFSIYPVRYITKETLDEWEDWQEKIEKI